MAEYIEREAAKLRIFEYGVRHRNNSSISFACENLKRQMNSIPAADVRPVVKAHWYWDKDGMDWNIGAWRCSACKAMSPMWWNTDRGSPMHKSGHNFCPNCGADMREES